MAKYNQLLRIEEDLDSQGVYFGPAMAANWFDEEE
jgi:enolase